MDNSTDSAKWPVIYKAVLIDGGMTTGKDAVDDCIKRIQSSYTFAPTKTVGKLQFDSVIITHWDRDHWGGVRDLLLASISEYLTKRSDLQAFVTASSSDKDQVKSLQQNVAGLQVPLFKYNGEEPSTLFVAKETATDPVAVSPDKLQTTFYIPYVHDEKRTGLRVAPKTSDKQPGAGKKTKLPSFIPNHATLYQPGAANTLGLLGEYSYKVGKATYSKFFRFFDVCKLVAVYQDYLGVDVFFNQTLPAGTSYTTIKNPGQLVKAQSLTAAMGPRMYIVAGDQVILGNTPLAQSATAAAPTAPPKNNKIVMQFHPVEHIIDEKDTALGTRFTGDRKTSEEMNCPSISCLILSSTTNTPASITPAQEGTSWKLWHYMVRRARSRNPFR